MTNRGALDHARSPPLVACLINHHWTPRLKPALILQPHCMLLHSQALSQQLGATFTRSLPSTRSFSSLLAHRLSRPSLANVSMTDFVPPGMFAKQRGAATAAAATGPSPSDKKPLEAITTHDQYLNSGLEASSLPAEPITLFHRWFADAKAAHYVHPENMTLATCTASTPPRPSSRVVLLKQLEPSGFTFYTNYASRKGRELAQNPWCSLTFHWDEPLHRSIRVCGRAERLTKEESQAYFDSRPVGSRIGAHASPQSTVIESREQLEQRVREFESKFNVPGAAGLDGPTDVDPNTKIEVPEYWGGWRVVPDEIEFWLGRENRLHDRFR